MKTNWFEMWKADKECVLDTMVRNMASDLENGYDYYDLCFWDGVHDAVESDVNEVTIDL